MAERSHLPGIVYIHVPKCGGSSFSAALRLRHLLSNARINLDQGNALLRGEARIASDYRARQEQLAALLKSGKRLITGHVHYNPELHDRYGYCHVTLLRDPVARFISHYRYLQRRHPDPARPARLADFLDSTDAPRLARQYLLYFGQGQSGPGGRSAPSVARALHNLSRFALIGDLGAPRQFHRALRRLSGGPLPYWHRNRAPRSAAVAPEIRQRIAALCAEDLQIYNGLQAARAVA
ncbi:sulfotransferase family 2 domain-containing protein [Sulfitobacter aestuarii]|uniref:Sulfotransferase family 2 domain-containing protein n=1 Tax=Sulfitobacter aestuarii TaxID=2161676 RepID=A0ABW5U371_9RHOB